MSATQEKAQEKALRHALHGTLRSVQPSPAPLETIVRRGKRIRLRRSGATLGAVGLAGIIAVTSLALGGREPTAPPAAPVITAGADGVFASGTADGHAWSLAVQNIADPGYTCLPAITLNGTDADPVDPAPETAAVVALGPAAPGVGFAFVQLPADVNGIVVNGGTNVPAVTATVCGLRYHVAGFAYSLAKPLRVTVPDPPRDWSPAFTMPVVSIQPPSKTTTPENPGLWSNAPSGPGESASGSLAWGTLPGNHQWVIKLQFGPGGDCYSLSGTSSAGSTQMGYCGPVSTPDGPETIMALPLGFGDGTGATGYAFPVNPSVDQLEATLSDGSSVRPATCIIDGRDYAAFVVPDPLRLAKLTWLDAQGHVIASTTALPRYGYVQFQP
ncbi:MAG: hypothetical protein ACRDOB_23440 [Streptosporangiaceae bacterium]